MSFQEGQGPNRQGQQGGQGAQTQGGGPPRT